MANDRRTGTRERSARQHQNDADRLAFLAEIATFYYVDKLNQEQIARQIGRSVSMVSRFLAEAQERGVVEVRVNHPVPTVPELQAALVQTFGLRAARVLRSAALDPARLLSRVGELAARYLAAIVTDEMVIGIGWGTALYEVVRAMAPLTVKGIHVAQSLGSLGSRLPAIDNHLLTRLLAERLNATPHYLPAPMIVESAEVRQVLVQDPQLRQTLELLRRADVMLVGIGVPEPERSGLLHAGYLDQETLEAIRATGAVGDMFVTYYDRFGRLLDVDVSRRVVGLSLADLPQIGTAIAVAGGAFKADAILGALRTGLLHVLVTDDVTAQAVLARTIEYPAPDGAMPGQRSQSPM